MNFSINKKTIKKMLQEPGHTVLEYNLMRTALNAMHACGKKEHEPTNTNSILPAFTAES